MGRQAAGRATTLGQGRVFLNPSHISSLLAGEPEGLPWGGGTRHPPAQLRACTPLHAHLTLAATLALPCRFCPSSAQSPVSASPLCILQGHGGDKAPCQPWGGGRRDVGCPALGTGSPVASPAGTGSRADVASPGLPTLRTPARPLQPNPHHHLAQLFQTSGVPGSEQGCRPEPCCAIDTQPEQGRKTTEDEGCSLQTHTHPSRHPGKSRAR